MAITATDNETLKEVKQSFKSLVNMSASQIDKWLDSDESKSVGQKANDDDESTGHKSLKNWGHDPNKK